MKMNQHGKWYKQIKTTPIITKQCQLNCILSQSIDTCLHKWWIFFIPYQKQSNQSIEKVYQKDKFQWKLLFTLDMKRKRNKTP